MKKIEIGPKGFTLLELLVVVVIIGILAAIALPQYQRAVMKSRYSSLMDTAKAIYEAEQRFYLARNKYAKQITSLDIDLSGCTLSSDKKGCHYDWGYCGIEIGTPNRVHCENTTNLQNAYVYYFDSPGYMSGSYCWALVGMNDKNNKYSKLCEAMGAKYVGGGTCTSDACRIYKF